MRRYSKIVVVFICCLMCYCRQPENKTVPIATSKSDSHKPNQAGYPISGILDLSKDTIIVIKPVGLFMTNDFGKHWKDISEGHFASGLTIDNNKTLWINSSSGGLHEPRVSVFYKSNDLGKHWEMVKWNAEKFWPLKIISNPYQPLKVLTDENKVYQLKGNDPQKDWKYLDSLRDDVINPQEHLSPYFIDSYQTGGYRNLCRIRNNRTDSLVRLDSLATVNNMVKVGSDLYIGGSRYGHGNQSVNSSYEAFLACVIQDRKLIKYPMPGSFATVVRGNDNRVWAFNTNHVYLKKDEKFVQFY